MAPAVVATVKMVEASITPTASANTLSPSKVACSAGASPRRPMMGPITVGPVTLMSAPKSQARGQLIPTSRWASVAPATVVTATPTVISPTTGREAFTRCRRSISSEPSKTMMATQSATIARSPPP